MADGKKMFARFCLLIFSILGVESTVPVLLWGSESLSSLPVPLAGHSVSSIAFQKNYLDGLLPCQNCDGKNLVVFVQDKLSVNDFTHYGHVFEDTHEGGVFHNVKSYMSDLPSLSLSSVHLAADTLSQLKKHFKRVQDVNLPGDLDTLKPQHGDNLVVVNLPNTHGAGRVESKLKENDRHIARVLKKYSDAGVPYTAMYTAKETSKAPSVEAVYAQGRHLLATAEASNGTAVLVKDCMLAYYTSLTVGVTPTGGSVSESPVVGKPDSSKSDCKNESNTNTMELTWKNDGQKVTDLKVSINFNMSTAGYWTISEMMVSYKFSANSTTFTETDVLMDASSIQGWKGYSYHCSNTGQIYQSIKGNDSNWVYLEFQGFQIQPFNLKNNKFSYANDCIGFFTIPIWSGLITAFILISILTFGLCMIVNINTMDRFDDPKGKTITINVDEK